jgi:deoxyribodipyrimidine photolyase-like uncharacterized protein
MVEGEKENLLQGELKVVNVGAKLFFDELKKQGVKVVHVEYKPPRNLDDDLQKILSEIL